MLQLILKDLLIQKTQKTALIALVLGVTVGFTFPSSPGLGSMQLLLGVYLMVVYANAFDYKYNSEVLFNSLPLGRGQFVTAKYVAAYIFAAIMLVIAFISNSVISLFTDIPKIPVISGSNALTFIVLSFFLLCIYLSIYFPIYFKYGYMSSRWANFVAMFALFGLMGGIGKLYDTKAETGFTNSGNPLDHVFAVITGTADSMTYLTLFAIGLLLLLLSINISIWVYRRKEF